MPFVAVGQVVMAALQLHATHKGVQLNGCLALYWLCHRHPQLRTELQRDPSMHATATAAAEVAPRLKLDDGYRDLLDWLKPRLGQLFGAGWCPGLLEVSSSVIMNVFWVSRLVRMILLNTFGRLSNNQV